jgi:hypothetical protein
MLKSKKLKTFTAILATALFVSGTNLTPAYAKGISKTVKEEYVKILKKGCVDDYDDMSNTKFNIVDLNNDGKDDLIVETFATPRGRSSCDVYLNFGNKIRKAKIIGVGVNGPFGQGSGESGGIFATDGIKLYKNYVMGAMHFWSGGVDTKDYEIYRIDKKGNLNLAYTYHYEFDEMSSKKSNKYHKIVNGKPKRISKNEYKKFASKFKEVKKEWHRWDLENIKEHVSSIKTDSNVTGKKHSVKAKKSKNLKAHLEYEKIMRYLNANPNRVFTKNGNLSKANKYDGEFSYHDFDGDKVDELICSFKYKNKGKEYSRELIYTYRNGKASRIFDREHQGPQFLYDFDSPYMLETPPGNGWQYYRIGKGKVVPVTDEDEGLKDMRGYFVLETIEITEANFKKYRNTYNTKDFGTWIVGD